MFLLPSLAMTFCLCSMPSSVYSYANVVGETTVSLSFDTLESPNLHKYWCGLEPCQEDSSTYGFRGNPYLQGCSCWQPLEPKADSWTLNLSPIPEPAILPVTVEGEVPFRLTAIDGERAARELRRAWLQVVRLVPSDETVLILAAHWAHETSGGRRMYNYNFGGIKGRSASGVSCMRTAHEGWGEASTTGIDRFRAYLSASEGAYDYVDLLARKYPSAISAARDGDILQFVHALRHGRYFTGSEAAYAQSLIELAERGQRSGFNALRLGDYSAHQQEYSNRDSRSSLLR